MDLYYVCLICNKVVIDLLLENETVEIKWSNVNKKRYMNLGYCFTKNGDSFYPKVKDVLFCSSGIKIPVVCDYCGQIYYPTTTTYLKSKSSTKKDCCVKCKGIEIKSTVQQKYGVDNVMQIDAIKEKFSNTCMKKYGVAFPLMNKDIFQKTQESLNRHYNIVNGVADMRSVDVIDEKIKTTNQERYGGNSPFASVDIRKKVVQKMFENGTCATSQKQIKLCDLIKSIYGNCELNYPCDQLSLDCMTIINNIPFDIEYDGWYFHKDRKDQDRKRNFFVGNKGYKIIRFLAYVDRLPTKEELVNAVNYLLQTNKKFIQIELT